VISVRWLRKAVVWTLASVCALFLLALVAIQAEQRLLHRRAEHLLAEIDAIEVGKTPWEFVKRQSQSWAGAETYDPNCTEHRCGLEVTRNDLVVGYFYSAGWPSRVDDYLRQCRDARWHRVE
jgi:hypothetical protein